MPEAVADLDLSASSLLPWLEAAVIAKRRIVIQFGGPPVCSSPIIPPAAGNVGHTYMVHIERAVALIVERVLPCPHRHLIATPALRRGRLPQRPQRLVAVAYGLVLSADWQKRIHHTTHTLHVDREVAGYCHVETVGTKLIQPWKGQICATAEAAPSARVSTAASMVVESGAERERGGEEKDG